MSDYDDEEWVAVKTVEDEEEGDLIVGYLRNEDIPSSLESQYSHEFPAHVGQLGVVEVQVPASLADRARRLLELRESEFEQDDEGEEA
jgi:hypothetical protein